MNEEQAATRTLLDPGNERVPGQRPAAPRLGGIEGRTVGLLDISKSRGDVFLNTLEALLTERGARVLRYRGAIDDDRLARLRDAREHLKPALEALVNGKTIEVSELRPFGSSLHP